MKEKLGVIFGNLRKESGAGQKEIGRGLLTATELSNVETGDREIDYFTLEALFERLGKSLDKFEMILGQEEYVMLSLRDKIMKKIKQGNDKRVEELLVKYESTIEGKKEIHIQYASMIRALLIYQQEENHVINDGKQQLKEINNLEFGNVYFRYPNSKEYVLEGVNFKIDKQTRTAFVGINGAGKSTLIKLILRMYDVTTGCIKINGKDIREYTIESLRMGFGVYLQNMENYYSSLRENILIGDIYTKHLDGEILELLQKMDCMGILQKGNNGLDSELTHNFSENGIELSGGENQKLAICRALLKKNVAYILDEPSSSLDPKTEDEIFKVLNKVTKNHLTIFTSHRLNNISLADQIIVLLIATLPFSTQSLQPMLKYNI